MSHERLSPDVQSAARQQQFLNVISRDEAVQRFEAALTLQPVGDELTDVHSAIGRVLAENVKAAIDIPGFDRSNVDGFAVRSVDTLGAMEESPVYLSLNNESLLPGVVPQVNVATGTATPISTGGMVPRGANAVVMIEETDLVEHQGELKLELRRSSAPGHLITYAGSDISLGETVLWAGTVISSREIGVLASLGLTQVRVYRQPRVGILSTGDEVVAPGQPLPVGSVYDSNAAILSAAVQECGGLAEFLGLVCDDLEDLRKRFELGREYDVLLISGGTSKGAGDLSYQIVAELDDPGIVAHGVALKPGKPICLAASQGRPVVVLPGFPTSAIFTFHEFVAPVVRRLAGRPPSPLNQHRARLPMRLNSVKGRTEYALVRLFSSDGTWFAYPIGKGSGSVTTYSSADGFLTIPQHCEFLEAGTDVEVTPLDESLKPVDLSFIGSHCVGLDVVLTALRRSELTTSVMHVGSEAGLAAVRRGECHVAGIHLFDPVTHDYNRPFLDQDLALIRGYRRMQSLVLRPEHAEQLFKAVSASSFSETPPQEQSLTSIDVSAAIQWCLSQPGFQFVNRNGGSGTRLLVDHLLSKHQAERPAGYEVQVKSHNAVAAAIAQQRADWGIAIDAVAEQYGLICVPIQAECYDFVIRRANLLRPAFDTLQTVLQNGSTHAELTRLGLTFDRDQIGQVVD